MIKKIYLKLKLSLRRKEQKIKILIKSDKF